MIFSNQHHDPLVPVFTSVPIPAPATKPTQ